MEKFSIETKDGQKIYKNVNGFEIGTYKDTIEDIISCNLEPLRDFLNLIPNDDEDDKMQRLLFIAKALLENAEHKIFNALEFVEKEHGKIEIVRAKYRQGLIPEEKLDIDFTPAKGILC